MLRVCVRASSIAFASFWTAAGATLCPAAGLLIADGGDGGRLSIEEQTVQVTINNGVAVTEVEQVFRNTENRQVEALYVFPVPHGGSVANFSMWINGKEMIGEVVEKQRARQVYESYKQRNIDPGLLEQKDYKTFEMRIFPIAAGARQRVRLSYYQELDFDADRATYTYPLATTASGPADAQTSERLSFNLRVMSQSPIVSMDSPSHGGDFLVVAHSPTFYEASYETTGGDLERDFVVAYQTRRELTGMDLVTSQPTGEENYFMLTLAAGDELAADHAPADYVFVLDVSGSMAFGEKLRLSRESISAFVQTLSPRDRVELMTFNIRPTTLFGELETVSDETMARARSFLLSQQAAGGTVLRPAMQTAYRYRDPDRPLHVVVLSDGMTEQRERAELLRLIQMRPPGVTVFTVGVGNEVDRPLLSQLAEEAGGLAAFLSASDDFNRQAQAFRRKLTRPAATNVRIAISGVETYDATPALIPNLYHGSPVRVYGRYRGDGPWTVTLDAEIGGRPYTHVARLDAGDGQNPEIERMWAQHQVESLLRDADRQGARSQVVDRVVDLAEAYSIVTPYTSFLVLENDAEYRRWKIERRNARRLGRDRQHRKALEERLTTIRDDSLARLGPQPPPRAPDAASGKPAHTTPEPSTMLLLLLGAGPLVLRRRRRPLP